MKDLFEYPELIPEKIQNILNQFNEDEDPYKECERILKLIEPLGYTFDYGLSGEPYQLEKMVYIPKSLLENLVDHTFSFANHLETCESDKPSKDEAVKFISINAAKAKIILNKN